jgi:hypothetical protein
MVTNRGGQTLPSQAKVPAQAMKGLGAKTVGVKPMGLASPRAFKKGGKVKKTGMALVHKGEKVVPKKKKGRKKRKASFEAARKSYYGLK